MKPKLIIWGGNRKVLKLETLDSHASVNAFFLTKYLQKDFDIINITDIDNPELILDFKNVDHVISTAQYGFTNRLIKKNKIELFKKIRNHVSGKLCSIADNANISTYYEDILFVVRPIRFIYRFKFLTNLISSTTFYRSGWCAEPDLFYPKKNKNFNIFIDHAPYNINAKNYVPDFYASTKRIVKEFPEINFNVYHQNNDGIVKWNFINDGDITAIYNRKVKVSYKEIINCIKEIHIFCYTHEESAGLSGVEAACAGAKLYIPRSFFGKTCIKRDLLDDAISFAILPFNKNLYYDQFMTDINNTVNRDDNHKRFSRSKHTWKSASEIIKKVLLTCY